MTFEYWTIKSFGKRKPFYPVHLSALDHIQLNCFDKYLVRNINSPIYFHQSTNIFFRILMMLWNAFWCPLKIHKRLDDFNPEKTNKYIIISIKRFWIGELENWWIDVMNKLKMALSADSKKKMFYLYVTSPKYKYLLQMKSKVCNKFIRWFHQSLISESTKHFNEYLLWFLFQLANSEKKQIWTNQIFFSFLTSQTGWENQ